MECRSLGALFGKLDRDEQLDWLATRPDVQAVLADEKGLFQNQEGAFVIATDRYAAADAVELVAVDYESLPALTDPRQAMAADAPVLREDGTLLVGCDDGFLYAIAE